MNRSSPMTDKMRFAYGATFVLVALAGTVGWLLGRDPVLLSPVLGAVTMAAGIGEASNIGKRATFNAAATKAEE